MAENIVATDLMTRTVIEIRSDRTLAEAIGALVGAQSDPARPNALVVVDAGGRFEGVITARLLFKGLLTLWMPSKSVREDASQLDRELLEVVRERSRLLVRDALIRGLPTVAPDDRLLTLIEVGCDQRLEFVPVLEAGRPVGLVPVARIFQAAASLALTPEHEGIRMEGEPPPAG